MVGGKFIFFVVVGADRIFFVVVGTTSSLINTVSTNYYKKYEFSPHHILHGLN